MNSETPSASSNKSEQFESLHKDVTRFKKIGKAALVLSEIDSYENLDELDEEQVDAFIAQLNGVMDFVNTSLKNQLDYNIINHKQINTKDALENELQSGTAIPELDIRFDRDGKPWVSHSPRAGTRFLFSKPIHELSSEEVDKYGQRLSLEDALGLVSEYNKNNDHRVVLEIKELGPTEEGREALLKNVGEMLEKNNLKDTAIFATLSPDLLTSIHDEFPENSKILNGGIAPIFSTKIEKSLEAAKELEIPIKFPGMELIFSGLSKPPKHNDGYGKQTGYIWFRLPKGAVEILSKMNENGQLGGASLTIVNKMANVLEAVNPKQAHALREKYAEKVHKLGLRVQTSISKTKPVESTKETINAMGDDTIIYSDTGPGEWAANLPKKNE